MKTKNPRFVMLLSALLAMLAAGASGQRLSRISPSHKGFLQDVNQQAGDVPAGSQQWSLLFPTDSLIVFSGGNYVAVPNDVMALSNANGIGTPDWTTVIPNGAPGSPAARTFSTG